MTLFRQWYDRLLHPQVDTPAQVRAQFLNLVLVVACASEGLLTFANLWNWIRGEASVFPVLLGLLGFGLLALVYFGNRRGHTRNAALFLLISAAIILFSTMTPETHATTFVGGMLVIVIAAFTIGPNGAVLLYLVQLGIYLVVDGFTSPDPEAIVFLGIGTFMTWSVSTFLDRVLETNYENRARLAELNQTLETRVAERTAELVAANASLLESEQRLDATLDALEAQICVLDANGTILVVNKAWGDFAVANGGSIERSGIGVNYLEICDRAAAQGDTNAVMAAQGIRAVQNGTRPNFFMQYHSPAPDAVIWYLMHVAPLSGSQSARVVVTHENITDRILAEQRREETSRLYRDFFEKNSGVKLLIDPATGNLIDANPAAARFYGYTLDELRAMKITQINQLPPDKVRAEMDRARREERNYFVFPHRLKNGDVRFVEVYSSPMQVGDKTYLYSTVHDITARIHAETTLRAAEERHRAILDGIPDMLFIIDRNGIFLDYQASTDRDLYAPPETFLGKNLRDVMPAELAAEMDRHLKVAQSTAQVQVFEYALTINGTANYFEARVVHFSEIKFLTIIRNITARKIADIELRKRTEELAAANISLAQANRHKDEFLATMSHELRTPLNAILGMTQILDENLYGELNVKQRDALGQIDESGRHLLSLINDILDLSKIQSGNLHPDFEMVVLSPLCQSVLRLIQPAARKKQQQLHFQLDDMDAVVEADARLLKQVLVNLLNNAVKFTPPKGRITLNVQSNLSAQTVTLSVADTGIGIAPADREKLFQPFVQLDSRLSRAYEGTGLGLALVKRIVELHHGTITLESEPGHGSTFCVCLPLTQMQPAQ